MSEQTMEDMIGEIPVAAPDAAPDVEPIKWFKKLDRTKTGDLRNTLHNIELIVCNDPRIRNSIAFNEFAQRPRLVKAPGRMKARDPESKLKPKQLAGPNWIIRDTANGDRWTEYHDAAVRSILEAPGADSDGKFCVGAGQGGYGLKVAQRDLGEALTIAMNLRSFHPVRDYLRSLPWDGLRRAESLFIDYLGCPENPYYRDVCRLWLLAAVTRVHEPGHKFDFVPILEGDQGKRKSTFIDILGRRWSGHLASDFHDTNRMIESMENAWILEIAELNGFARSDVRTVKDFVSRNEDKGRLAWAKSVKDYPRQCVFIGSSNDKEYLRDDTGGRRWWPVEVVVETIDTERLEREIDQVWAEVLTWYEDARKAKPIGMLPLYLTDADSKRHAEEAQELRRVETEEDVWLGQVQGWLDTPIKGDGMDEAGEDGKRRDVFCALQIAVEALAMTQREYASQSNAQRLGRVLRRVKGFKKTGNFRRFDAPYNNQREWVRLAG